jgi:uncharacterized protein (TIGR04255 family)
MARRREKLAHAPIVEALIDFRVAPGTVLAGDLDRARKVLVADYPTLTGMRSVLGTFDIDTETLNHKKADLGVMGRSADGHNVAQWKLNGLTFNRLAPYTDWPSVFGEANRLWQLYSSIQPDVRVTRLAVRYINRMTISAGARLGDYLEAPPTLPPQIPQHLREYISRVVVQDPEQNLSAVLTQALEPGPDHATGSILLDIDAFQEQRRPLSPDDPLIVETFAQLRNLKNEIFYAAITEPAVERFE